jgi:ribose transport system substrate-binding protein
MGSVESRIANMAETGVFPHPLSRRAFMAVAAAAGVALGVGGKSAAAGVPRSKTLARLPGSAEITTGPTYCQVTTLSNDFFVAFNDGAEQFTAALGLPLTTLEDDANVNTAISQVGNVQTAGGQMLFGTPASEAQAEAVIRACEDAGIFYGSAYTSPRFFTPADSATWIRFLTPPSVTIAYQTAKALFDEVGGTGTIVHVPGQPGSSADDERTAGLLMAAEEYPDIEIVTTSPGNWISEDARVAFSNALPSINDFSGVYAQNDSEATGVIAALDAQGITGKVVTGFDGNAQNIQLIADGKQFMTSATIGGLTAALLGIAVFDAFNGVEFSLPERFMFQGAVLVNGDFAQEFLDTVYGDELPFDWELMSRALHPEDWDPQTLLQPIVPSEFFANAEPGEFELNPAWEAEAANIETVAADYRDRFTSGPLFAYKDSMVA